MKFNEKGLFILIQILKLNNFIIYDYINNDNFLCDLVELNKTNTKLKFPSIINIHINNNNVLALFYSMFRCSSAIKIIITNNSFKIKLGLLKIISYTKKINYTLEIEYSDDEYKYSKYLNNEHIKITFDEFELLFNKYFIKKFIELSPYILKRGKNEIS